MTVERKALGSAALISVLALWGLNLDAPTRSEQAVAEGGRRIAPSLDRGPELHTSAPEAGPTVRVAEVATSPNPRAAWRTDELWLALQPDADAARVAEDHGLRLRRAPGASGLSAVRLPAGLSLAEAEQALSEDPRVERVQRVGQILGAARGPDRDASRDRARQSVRDLSDLQWHLQQIGMPELQRDLSGLVVAVLDSGAAYEDEDGYYAAESLANVDVVAPFDFVNGDKHPEDDHLHGTHISSLIVSNGAVQGVAAGASLMPLKVLDHNNSGSEADLVDALYWAVDQGADVINLSLVFPEGYSPSAALQAALEYAHDAQVIMIAASGNDGDGRALYPAASPLVISVGASSLRNPSEMQLDPTGYSNLGATVDVLAPGGDLNRDADQDGYPDGLLAEGPPSADGEPTYYLYAGTSQATALVSGAALHLLAEGVRDPDAILKALQQNELRGFGANYVDEGAGVLNVGDALRVAESERWHTCTHPMFAMVMPYLAAEGGRDRAQPRAWVGVVDDEGEPLGEEAQVFVTAWSPDGYRSLSCSYDNNLGGCEVSLPSLSLTDRDGQAVEAGWGFTVDGVQLVGGHQTVRPLRGVFVTGGLVVLTEALELDGELEGSLLGLRWSQSQDPVLGDLAPSYSILDLGVGAASRPAGLLLTEGLMQSLGVAEELDVSLDGTGLVTEPLGRTRVSKFTLDGSGLVTEPLGFTGTRLLFFDGSGLVTEPLGFHGMDLFSFEGSGLVTEPLGFSGELLRLDTGSLLSVQIDDTAFGGLMADGGLLMGQGEQAPEWFNASGVLLSGGELGVQASIAGYQRRALIVDPSRFTSISSGTPSQQREVSEPLSTKGTRLR